MKSSNTYKSFALILFLLGIGVLFSYFVFTVDFDTLVELIFAIMIAVVSLGVAGFSLFAFFMAIKATRDAEDATLVDALIADILRLENPKISYEKLSGLLHSPDTKARFGKMSVQELRNYRNNIIHSTKR